MKMKSLLMVWFLSGDSMKEQWREIENYENYLVSDRGRVYSYYTKKFLKPRKNTDGYFQVVLCKNGIKKSHTIHRLVALAFIPNMFGKRTVNHMDGVKTNNFVSNLEWATYSENNQHAYDNGLQKAKLSEDQVLEIRKLYKAGNYYQKDLGKMFCVDQTLISRIINRKRWKHI